MSYVSSFVHAKPTTEILAKENKATHAKATSVAAKKELTTKIVLFAAIIICLVVAVNI